MKKRITESQLRNIVAESIKKVLKESAFRYTNTDDFLNFLNSQGEDPTPFMYNAMKEMNLENEFDFSMGPRVVFYKIIKPYHPDIYEEIGKKMYRIWQENLAKFKKQ